MQLEFDNENNMNFLNSQNEQQVNKEEIEVNQEDEDDGQDFNYKNYSIKFPHQMYQGQIDFIQNLIDCYEEGKNGIFESPTGTGKTLCLLASAIAYNKKQPNGKSQIIYATRTVGQINGIIKEINKLKQLYKHDLDYVIMTGRKNLCVNPQVKSSYEIDKICSQMTYQQRNQNSLNEKEREKNEEQKQNSKENKEYMNDQSGWMAENSITSNVQNEPFFQGKLPDIEDLREFGQSQNICPYYMQKNMTNKGKIILLTYNYLTDPSILKITKNLLQKKDNNNTQPIIIFDEAHNLEKSATEQWSLDLKAKKVKKCIKAIKDMQEYYSKLEEQKDRPYLKELIKEGEKYYKFALKYMEENVLGGNNNINIQKNAFQIEDDPLASYVFEYCQYQKKQTKEYNQKKYNPNQNGDLVQNQLQSQNLHLSQNQNQNLNQNLNQQDQILSQVQIINQNLHQSQSQNQNLNQNQNEQDQNLSQVQGQRQFQNQNQNGNSIYDSDIFREKITFLPLVVNKMLRLIKNKLKAKSIILASGTMKPYNIYQNMGINFQICKNFGHVIQGERQLFCQTITAFNKFNLDFSYRADQSKMKQHQQQIELLIKKYLSITKKGENKKAIFFGVSGGKLSEGIDFPDDMARCIIVLGLPYPQLADPLIKSKMNYFDQLNEQSKKEGQKEIMDGDDWYVQQCSKQINQILGRGIRHKNDYCAMFLVDERLGTDRGLRVADHMSQWLFKSFKGQKDSVEEQYEEFWDQQDKEQIYQDCFICFENQNIKYFTACCGHPIHYQCYKNWQAEKKKKNDNKKVSCPLCRQQDFKVTKIIKYYDRVFKQNLDDLDLQNNDQEIQD
ncbi:P-loop containing nucleoside triphosphate hydrolase [Pseudocohnilembus persalinus]|uniref:p-loop containing nucleoside triphosphate hydrolase n=1 Tax=Pseudocohnilembus persalinus TaxID=266149 RepID=A0A0V0QD37_PSEPJ|nr:P-loop containing nucleoside triphosphate hydrolase [Pseudocohnilembus persalinus]|eukprot:KRX00086.1 P-loop containing nucleoside triphosphate hydrolase [Pseudocohnilembus persalinus]